MRCDSVRPSVYSLSLLPKCSVILATKTLILIRQWWGCQFRGQFRGHERAWTKQPPWSNEVAGPTETSLCNTSITTDSLNGMNDSSICLNEIVDRLMRVATRRRWLRECQSFHLLLKGFEAACSLLASSFHLELRLNGYRYPNYIYQFC